MRLIYIANVRMPTEKAHGYQIAKMCEQFITQAGVELELWVPARVNQLKDTPADFYHLRSDFKIRRFWCLDFIGRWSWLGRLPFWLQRLTFLWSLKFTALPTEVVIYTRDIEIAALCSRRGRRVIYEVHSLPSRPKRAAFYRLLKSVSGLVVLTASLKKILVTEGQIKVPILVAPDAVDLTTFSLKITLAEARTKLHLPAQQKLIGYFGRFTTMGQDKGIRIILQALTQLPDVYFIAVGGQASDVAYYQQEVTRLGLTDRVTISGSVSQSTLALYQKACDLLLMPFPNTEHYAYYMSPLKMFEYMASGRPIIASDLPSVREVLNDTNACLVPPDDPQALALAVTKLLTDPTYAQALATQALSDVKQYTWEKRVEGIKPLLSESNYRLIYATSFSSSSALANRFQVLAMAKAFASVLREHFYLGVTGADLGLGASVQQVNFTHHKSFILAFKYLQFLRREQINQVYCREPKLLLFMAWWNRLLFWQPLVFNYEVHTISHGLIERGLEKLLTSMVSHYFFVTKHLADAHNEKYPKRPEVKVVVLPDAVDLNIFGRDINQKEARQELALPLERKIIGYFGRFKTMGQGKGLELVLEILGSLAPEFLFVAAGGKKQDVLFYKKMADDLNLKAVTVFSDHSTDDLKQIYTRDFTDETKAIIADHTTQEKIALYQKACDLLLMPFPNTEHYAYYMSPLKMFEYMASGRPIIASDLPSVREVLNDTNACLVPPDDPQALALAVTKLLTDPTYAQALATQALSDVKQYTWEKRVEGILARI